MKAVTGGNVFKAVQFNYRCKIKKTLLQSVCCLASICFRRQQTCCISETPRWLWFCSNISVPLLLFLLCCARISRWLTTAQVVSQEGLRDQSLLCNFTFPVDLPPVFFLFFFFLLRSTCSRAFTPVGLLVRQTQQFDKCTSQLLWSTKKRPDWQLDGKDDDYEGSLTTQSEANWQWRVC